MINKARTRKTTRRGFRPDLEAFEARLVLSTLLVNPLALDGARGSLRAAIVIANNQSSGTVNILAIPGNYTLTQGDIVVDGANISIRSTGVLPVDISASSGSKIFDVEGGTLTLANVALRNGHNATDDEGGAVYIASDATLNAAGCLFTDNYSDEYGGAIENDGTLHVVGSTFSNNVAADYGGAIYNDGVATIVGSIFLSNSSDEYGGAIYSEGLGDSVVIGGLPTVQPLATSGNALTITGCDFTSNTTYYEGGALYNESGMAFISASTFTANSTLSEEGGAIYNDDVMTLNTSTFTDNKTLDDDGGAIYNDDSLAVNYCNFSGNTTANGYDGGAIYNAESLAVRYSNFTGNSANGSGAYGGAIENEYILSIVGSSFIGNYADTSGSAIDNETGTTAVISASAFVGNTSADHAGYAIDISSNNVAMQYSTVTLTNCIVSDNDSGVDNSAYSTLNLNGCRILHNGIDDILNDGTTNISLSRVTFSPSSTGTVNTNP